jgi:hypothetical protein
MGLLLSLTKLRKEEVQPLIDKLANSLPFWKARLLTREGLLVYVQAVMTSSVISVHDTGFGTLGAAAH